jgi:hypothetical protein
MPAFGVRKGRRPNKGFQRTALGAERDRSDFDSWKRLDSFPDLEVRRG